MYTRLRQISFLFVISKNVILKKTPHYNHFLKYISKDVKKGEIFKLVTNNNSAIRRFKEGRANAIMLAGGPKLIEGQLLSANNDYKIAQIIYLKGSYYIILEKCNQ